MDEIMEGFLIGIGGFEAGYDRGEPARRDQGSTSIRKIREFSHCWKGNSFDAGQDNRVESRAGGPAGIGLRPFTSAAGAENQGAGAVYVSARVQDAIVEEGE